jgi:hypothetical protein
LEEWIWFAVFQPEFLLLDVQGKGRSFVVLIK